MQRSTVQSVGRAYLSFVRYVGGGVTIVTGAGMLLTPAPIYIKPFGVCLAIAGVLVLPVTASWLGKRAKQFQPWYVSLLMAGAALWGGVVFSVIAYSAWEKAHPEIAAKLAAQRKAKEQAEKEQVRAEVAQRAKQDQAAALAKRGERQQAFSAMWGQVTAQMEPCEKSQRYLAKLLTRPGTLVQSYQMASRGQQVCYQTYNAVRQITAPAALSEKASKLATEGLAGCAEAMLARMTYLDIAGKVIDGDRRPSKLAEAQAQNQAADLATLQCVAKLTEAGLADGLKLEKR